MKLVVFSDNHRDRKIVQNILLLNPNADRYISLGDSEMSEAELSSMNVFGVKGNYPFEPKFPYDLMFEFEGWKTLLTHGHRYFVKNGLYTLYQHAEENQCQLVLFGHTHQCFVEEKNNILFVNPGSATFPKGSVHPTYAVLSILRDKIDVQILDCITNEILLSFIKTSKG
ncbi:MAG: metallophosphoesterase [Firmicutes bacterium]|nr:metallophosphoesterase [Bacillota bacterium]